ncbi:MAG TPA: glucose-6-phosphate isomerase family protein [Candidatus Hydrogenedentes bacterium]|nr:glucose-6-phosphate isomerase family protein [Candidatus Hydrogenedentota bacterium]HOS03527.1 glucose-6-phosphate isomerase family protein [Candidatus Hydrogenedentota bacterium]
MDYMQPFGVDIDLVEGVMRDHDRVVVRRASAMLGHYADGAALQALIDAGDPVHYEVFEKAVPAEYGHLLFCISKLYPGRVGDEYFMTKGHYHTVAETAEVYLCLRGKGYMLMKTAEGGCVPAPMARNRLVYVPPYWAHRSINTGDEPLISLCIYPGDAGHNYGDIEREGFPKRVFFRGGQEVIA